MLDSRLVKSATKPWCARGVTPEHSFLLAGGKNGFNHGKTVLENMVFAVKNYFCLQKVEK